MFLRKLEKGECPIHTGKWKCRTARLMECDECGGEFIAHKELGATRRSYCSPECTRRGGVKKMKHAEEVKKKWRRIKTSR